MGLINKSYLVTLNQRVTGSSPVAPTNHFNNLRISALTLKNVVCALCPQSRCRYGAFLASAHEARRECQCRSLYRRHDG